MEGFDDFKSKSVWCMGYGPHVRHAECPYDGMRDRQSIGCACYCHMRPDPQITELLEKIWRQYGKR